MCVFLKEGSNTVQYITPIYELIYTTGIMFNKNIHMKSMLFLQTE